MRDDLALVLGIAALWWLAAIATFVASLFGAVLQPRIQRRRATGADLPPVSLILPVKLVNPGFERAQASAFDQAYPTYEVIVGALETQSPALTVMRALTDASKVPAQIVRSTPVGAVSPKLDTLATPLDRANHDVIVTKDSNITLTAQSLRMLVRNLASDVGLVCAVPVAVRAQTFAGHVEAIMVNRDARMLLTASAAGKGYGVGKVMVFRRSDLARAGGLAILGYTIAEDTALCRAIATIGLRSVFADTTVDQEIGARCFRDVYARQARWAVIRKTEEPLTFALEPFACPLLAGLAAAFAAPLVGAGAATGCAVTLVSWYLAEVLVAALKNWEIRPWTPQAFVCRDLLLLTAWVKAWTTREVIWAGRKQDVHDALRRPKRT